MKIYVVSGLGADFKVLEKLNFPTHLQVVFLNWLIPERKEPFEKYVERMGESIDTSEDFYLLGYSFGGIIVQELHKIKPAKKVVILGSIRSDQEKSKLIKLGQLTRLPSYLPTSFFSEKTTLIYSFVRKLIDPKNPQILKYFTVRDPYYLKWSIAQISSWKSAGDQSVIQILADRDIVFPLKNSEPDYVIKNATHLFPATKHKEVSILLAEIFT